MLIGLRPAEVCESVSLICKSTDKYYNPERQALEHFKFPEIFLRQTKKAYISFVTPEMLKKFEIEQILKSHHVMLSLTVISVMPVGPLASSAICAIAARYSQAGLERKELHQRL